jgi:hypothetical protein
MSTGTVLSSALELMLVLVPNVWYEGCANNAQTNTWLS